jgi:hypothetical protein
MDQQLKKLSMMAELAQGLQLNISNLKVYCKVKQEMII